ncbi:MAG: efflux transporter outer membrane subunit [Candidatus Accumulibacter sp.]|uniref:Efflux transporter outer membrane subunit n=1 Tax=Candidatus Accumulibacter affinis TaxID=2954384 RepID=A0A935T9C2_9PROT|nr:efflux transporter outer membrane subunit [Candidatus Accumulibacter affinis]MBP9804894.1 efflux transporter outer membrane subunit [Accumulibacter sp.]
MRQRLAGGAGPRLAALAAALLLGGCAAVGPDFKRPEVQSLADWSGGSLATLAAEQRGRPRAQTEEWWRNFNDPVLDALVAEAQRVNPNVRTAGMRILEARAQLAIAGSLLYPQQQQVSGTVLRTGTEASSGPDTVLTAYSIGFGIGWEIDFWGKFRRSIEAADAGYFASIAQYDDLQVLVAAQTASFYAAIRTLELRLTIAHENAALQKRSLEITERLFKHGSDSELDVQQAKSQYLSTLATIPQLEGSLRQTQNALSVLLARPPGPLPEMAAGRERIPQTGLAIVADMPAEMLRRRPDVRAAEMQLAAQSALIGVSVADLYPSIALLGSLGVASTSLPGAVRKFDWAIGPSLVWNVFDHGRLSNEVLVQDARFQQLYEQYQGTVLQAAREVDDGAVGFVANREQVPLLEESVKAAKRSLDIATIQYREGMAGFERVLDSQRALFNQQERLVNNLGNVAQSLITLYKAMGGGWQQARSRPLVDDATRETMAERSDWREMLAVPLPPPDAAPPQTTPEKEER